MEARWHDALRLVPWESWQLWNEVREAIFSSIPDQVSAAINKIAAWRARNCLPVAVEVTWDLISIQMTDPHFSGNSGLKGSLTNEMLCLMYSMAIMRLINGIVDHSKKQSSLSVADRAEAAGLPRMLVDIRHEVAHQELPSLSYLRLASKEALEWLKVHYWEAQRQVLNNAHKHYQDRLQAYASNLDPSECGSRKRFLTLRAKKLIKLSGPVVNLFDDCNSDGIGTDGAVREDTEQEKDKDFLCSDDSVDALLQKSKHALSRAKKRLQSFCRSHDATQSDGNDADLEGYTDEKIESGHSKNLSCSKAVWVVADNWKPCAIGMLPSKVHPAGVLPFLGDTFPGVANQATACEVDTVQEKPLSDIDANVPVMEDIDIIAPLEMEIQALNSSPSVEKMDLSESEVSDPMLKRLKTEREAQRALENQEGLCPLDSQFLSDVPSKDVKLVREGPLYSGRKPSLPAGGLLLVDGIYQRCGVDQLAMIRSSIQILK